MNALKISVKYSIIIGMMIGAFTYLLLYGVELLDVTNVIWLYDKADLTQHYNGWQFFRNSDWFFPIGLMNTVTYPDYYSVVFTDAIPLLALPFKVLSPILPEVFQYFGIWGMLCYILQGMIAACILRRYITDKIVYGISIAFLTFSPWMFHRLYMHSSLAAHWIILLCILLCLYCDEISLKRYVIYWSSVFALATMVHIYFVPMCGGFLGCNTLYLMWKKRKKPADVLMQFGVIFIPIIVSLSILWLLGAFYGSLKYSSGGMGEASANLNFLFNSAGKSRIFPALPNPMSLWPEESFGYMGAGAFVLGIYAVLGLIINKTWITVALENRAKVFFTAILLLIFLWIATAPVVAWNNHLYFRWLLMDWLRWFLDVFRSLGRFVWPICYILLILIIMGANRMYNKYKKFTFSVIILCFALQLFDFSGMIRDKVTYSKSQRGYQELRPEVWDTFAKNYKHIYSFDWENWEDISTYAASRDITVNQTYLARLDNQALLDNFDETFLKLQNGEGEEDILYIFPGNWNPMVFKELVGMNVHRVDNYFVGVVGEAGDLK